MNTSKHKLGQRILIIGCAGAGKLGSRVPQVLQPSQSPNFEIIGDPADVLVTYNCGLDKEITLRTRQTHYKDTAYPEITFEVTSAKSVSATNYIMQYAVCFSNRKIPWESIVAWTLYH